MHIEDEVKEKKQMVFWHIRYDTGKLIKKNKRFGTVKRLLEMRGEDVNGRSLTYSYQ